jgi:tryptophan-rich sensory protein
MKKRFRKKQKRQSKYRVSVLLTSFAFVIAAAFFGSLFTSQSVDSAWYQSIKPAITPPNYVFPIAWTILFALIALSMFFAISNSKPKEKGKVLNIFTINLMLNVMWSVFYFGLHDILAAFITLIAMWFSIIMMIASLLKVSRPAAYMLIPYSLWVTFAGVLNYLSMIKLM